MKKCKVDNCNGKYYAKSCCNRHYNQVRRYGKIQKRTTHNKNEFIDCGDYYEIIIYNNKSVEVARTLIDKEDYEKCKDIKWGPSSIGYIGSSNFSLHIFILGEKKGFDIDHINHNTLDNRKRNLRHCSHSENCMNQKAKGYSWSKDKQKWVARITVNYKRIHLGYFKTESEAIKARHDGEIKYFGKYAHTQY